LNRPRIADDDSVLGFALGLNQFHEKCLSPNHPAPSTSDWRARFP